MKKNVLETIIGALVLLVAASFVYTAYSSSKISAMDGYLLTARFDKVDGLSLGSDVRLSGLKVGTVVDQVIDPASYQAVITVSVDDKIKLPKDSTAKISSDGLLGGKYLALVPGADEEMLSSGGVIEYTQSSVNFEELIGKFIFGGADDKNKKDGKDSNAEKTF